MLPHTTAGIEISKILFTTCDRFVVIPLYPSVYSIRNEVNDALLKSISHAKNEKYTHTDYCLLSFVYVIGHSLNTKDLSAISPDRLLSKSSVE